MGVGQVKTKFILPDVRALSACFLLWEISLYPIMRMMAISLEYQYFRKLKKKVGYFLVKFGKFDFKSFLFNL